MPRSAAIAAALLALAACKVDVEGAPCAAAGASQDCPSGQACGNDRRCSERAAACTAPEARCTPGTTRCAGQGSTTRAETCTDADPVCGAWVADACGSRGLLCDTHSANQVAACECSPGFAGPEFTADPAQGSPATRAPFATGAATPPECRFRSLGEAVARAGRVTGPAAVQVRAPSGAQAIFGAPTGDGAITIPANVAVIGAPAPAAATILRPAAAHGETLVTVEGSLAGVAVEPGTGDAVAIATACGATGTPTLTDLVVDGGGVLTAGIHVSGACGAELSAIEVSNVSGPALRVHADAAAQVTVSAGALRASATGAEIAGGDVTFGATGDASQAMEIAGNANEGIVFTGGAAVDAHLYLANVHGNGGTGVVVEPMSPGSKIALVGCDVHSNGDVTPRNYGPDPGRPVGGILVATGALPFTFAGNRAFSNEGDQLAFESSSGWAIGPSACGASSNLFACVDEGEYAVAIAGGGTVDARNTVWPSVPFQSWASPGVTGSYCNGVSGVPAMPPCN